MTQHSFAIAQPRFHRKPSPVALGLVALLHLGLVVAIGNGLGAKSALQIPQQLRLSVIEAPQLPTKPLPVRPQPVELNPPVTPIDRMPILPAIEGPSRGITPAPSPAETKPAPVAPRKVVVAPAIDPRRPLTQPDYPPSSRRAGEQGKVELMLYVLADGRIGEARVARSSGHRRLDDAAVKEALRAWRLLPQREDGVAVAAWHRIAVTFRLER